MSKRALLFSVTLGTAFLGGCGGGGSSPAPATPSTGLSETTAGRWKPFLIDAASVADSGVPLGVGSASERAELDTLLALQNARTPAQIAQVGFWNAGASLRWNAIARDLVTSHNTAPPVAARLYAYLSIAQYDALVAAYRSKYRYNRLAPAQRDARLKPLIEAPADPSYPAEHATVAAASTEILKFFYPSEGASLDAKENEDEQSRLVAGVNYPSDLTAGETLGRAVAQKVIERAGADSAASASSGPSQPSGPGIWPGTNPLLPGWGRVQPLLLGAGDQFRPTPPPAFGSPEFNAALAEVRDISDHRTPQQLEIANFWADAAETFTPPGHWNLIAERLLLQHPTSEIRAARTFALLNASEMDAGICCWDAKYTYWLLRPSQADPAITTPIGLPNFPSYTSGHSSFSGAAESVLGYLFPAEAATLHNLAEEAGISRIYGGIHYRFDSDWGLKNGRAIGALAITRAQADGSPAFTNSGAALSEAAFKAATVAATRTKRSAAGASRSNPNWD
ncbi:PAP2 superfamily protein [Abditibacterium utsteinense]|uniref:PAP2 superfamily protein n=1 Tax=Abditibacterium utsteinense TaxID=1960156 RepID=A0A2S8SWI7_9BACT|nr:vanadium-dependent haloperoxidase [Abditibacterium utsteinense]PQV65168.1 PAP2 superfamily protein [Abditibacterium utsteinense]